MLDHTISPSCCMHITLYYYNFRIPGLHFGICQLTAMASNNSRRRSSQALVVEEGFLNKKGGLLKGWSRRYFMLNRQSLVYFRKGQAVNDQPSLKPMGRLFLSDITKIETEGTEQKKANVFVLHTKKRAICLQASNAAEQAEWVAAIRNALDSEGEAERKDPFRQTLRRLARGLKRVTLMKDPEKGIGCTIKSGAGHIFVNRIIEDGPIAHTGVLRPDDEILDVNGVTITGMTIAEVGQVIRNCPNEFLATVRPITAPKKLPPPDVTRVNYITVLPNLLSVRSLKAEMASSTDSLDDVGNYDDEDEDSNLSFPEVETADSIHHPPAPLTGNEVETATPSEQEQASLVPIEVHTYNPTVKDSTPQNS